MKILIVLESYDGASNGNTISARTLADRLKARGHEVRIAAAGESREDKWGFGEFHLPFFDHLVQAQGFTFGRPDKRKMEEAVLWADVIHVMMPFPLGKQAVILAKKHNVPCTGAFHIQPENIWFSVGLGDCMPLINFTYWFAKRYIFRHFSIIHCPSRMIANMLGEHHYKAEKRVISNGIPPMFHYNKIEKSSEFAGNILIVMTARLSREKKQNVLIEAIRKSRYSEKIQLVLAGKGPMKEEYEKEGSSLPNPVIMKFLPREELLKLLWQADLYAHSSDIDIEPISCMEAIASGLVPVISDSKRSGAPQFALDERSLFKSGDSADFARKIDWWIEHEDERKRMEHVYAEEAKKYALEPCINQMLDMFADDMRRCGRKVPEPSELYGMNSV